MTVIVLLRRPLVPRRLILYLPPGVLRLVATIRITLARRVGARETRA